MLLAIVGGEPGARIQRWRERWDAEQARRYPPHATLHYRVPHEVPLPELGRQVRHAFAEAVTVRLGGPAIFENKARTLYVQLLETAALDAAQDRLHDGTIAALPLPAHHEWHVTAVRTSADAPADVFRLAERELSIDQPWRIDRVALLELRGERYEVLDEWSV